MTHHKSLQNSTLQLQAQNLFYVDMESLGPGDPGCRVRLSSYGSKGSVELHVELENRSKRAMALPLGSFTAGSSSSCILAAFLQSLGNDGTWRSAAVLQPRGYATQQAALFLPAFQAVKMPISGKVVNLGRFGGVALRVGGDAPNAAEVLVALGEDIGQNGQTGQSQMSKPLVRFTVGKPLKTSRVDTNPVWIGPHEPRQPRRYTTFDTEIVSDVCDLAVFDDVDAKHAPRMQTRRLQAFQHSLSPELPVPKHHCDHENAPRLSEAGPRRSTFSGFRSARIPLQSRPATVPAESALQAEDTALQARKQSDSGEHPDSTEKPLRLKSPALPSLTVIHHGTTWRKLGRRQDILADPILLELAEAACNNALHSSAIALMGRCFQGRLGQRFADALRSLGYKVILGNALVSWVSAFEDSNDIADVVLVAHWTSLPSCIGILQAHALRSAVVLCDHCDEASAMAEAKSLPCPWQVVPSLIFN